MEGQPLAQLRVQGVSTCYTGTGQHMACHRLTHVVAIELTIQGKGIHIECVHLEVIMMNDLIVPGRAGTIGSRVSAVHVGGASQELGVVVHATDTDGAGTVWYHQLNKAWFQNYG